MGAKFPVRWYRFLKHWRQLILYPQDSKRVGDKCHKMKGITQLTPAAGGVRILAYRLRCTFMVRVARTLFTWLSLLALAMPVVEAQQEQPAPQQQDPTAKQSLDRAQKKKIRKTLKELDTPYKQWLNEDVVYIISPEERNAFGQLATNEEREQFIEQFWLRRSTNPDLPDNEFKEEHYRRIAYANEHYASGIPGWKTDRGHMYIVWGPPDEIESHPTGGTYDRPMEEGGGSTSTYPWETWRWRYIEGMGENVIMEFVDPSGSGEYHLTMDPSEKDALACMCQERD